MITFERLESIQSQREHADILRLLTQLYGTLKVSPTHVQINATAKENTIMVARNSSGAIIGMATLVIYRQFAKTIAVAEDVVVMPGYRRQSISYVLMNMLEKRAKNADAQTIDLVTDDHRTAACALYRKLGYEKRDKINFRKSFD